MNRNETRSRAVQTFFFALLLAALAYLPYLILNDGYFFLYGDFNVQQIPFYQHAHRAIHAGEVFWDWKTDLGASFVGSYSFYLLFSPFFWLTLPFPNDWLPMLMAPLLMLKTACAALTGYWYIQRFVRDKVYGILGGLLYAFSGFMLFNIFFNHFHEVVVFFPLMLIGLEELVMNRRRGVFALAVAICAVVNYWFFIGEVVFTVLYVLLRSSSRDWKMTFGRFCMVAFESLIGLGMACFAFLPSVLALIGNPRTTGETFLSGWQFWLYIHEQRPAAILQSLFFPPELPSNPNFLPDHGAKWASLSGWLPLVGMAGVIAYLAYARRDWLKKMLLTCLFIALVPGLNSLFILGNHSYYARWFYMPILLMCVATVVALERAEQEELLRGARWNFAIVLGFSVAIGLTPQKVEEEWRIGLYKDAARFWSYVGIALFCAVCIWVILRALYRRPGYARALLGVTAAVCYAMTTIYLGMFQFSSVNREWLRETAIGGREQIVLPQEEFGRVDLYECPENLGMFWDLPNIQAFHSVVPASIMQFYPEVGVKRDVSSKPEAKYYALRSLLSVKWLFIDKNEEEQEPMPGWRYYAERLGYNIYINENFVPMGFTYDNYLTRETFDNAYQHERSHLLLKAMLLEGEALERNADLLTELTYESDGSLTEEEFTRNAAARAATACSSFVIDKRGFSATIDLPRENLVFFSVPYEKGWSATVNGEPATVEQVNIGFMAVRCPAGHSEIRFDFIPYGMPQGVMISLGALVVLNLWLLLGLLRRPRRPQPQEAAPMPPMLSTEEAEQLASLTAMFDTAPGEVPQLPPEEEDEVMVQLPTVPQPQEATAEPPAPQMPEMPAPQPEPSAEESLREEIRRLFEQPQQPAPKQETPPAQSGRFVDYL